LIKPFLLLRSVAITPGYNPAPPLLKVCLLKMEMEALSGIKISPNIF
jgi:hypothetical protein